MAKSKKRAKVSKKADMPMKGMQNGKHMMPGMPPKKMPMKGMMGK